jgi:hypothetical protein
MQTVGVPNCLPCLEPVARGDLFALGQALPHRSGCFGHCVWSGISLPGQAGSGLGKHGYGRFSKTIADQDTIPLYDIQSIDMPHVVQLSAEFWNEPRKLLAETAGLKVADGTEILRQQGDYKNAAQALSEARILPAQGRKESVFDRADRLHKQPQDSRVRLRIRPAGFNFDGDLTRVT